MTDRAARGSLSGSIEPRQDCAPNMRGALTLERDMRAGERLRLAAWTRAAGGARFLSIEAQHESAGSRGNRKGVST